MPEPRDEEIAELLMLIIELGFNRSLGALEKAGAVDTKRMDAHYRGMGSKYYDLVTEQMQMTAKYGIPAVRALFAKSDGDPEAV